MEDNLKRKYAGLRRFNAVMGILHLIQAIVMTLLSNDTFSLTPNPQLAYELPFGAAVAIFLLLSAIAHFYLSTIGYGWYVRKLEKHMNPARFYEYALSSSWMIVLIGMLVGIWDLGSLILMFGLNAMMNFFGIMMELHNQTTERTNWTSFVYGAIAGVIPWVVIMMYFVGALSSSGAEPPAFVYAIIPTIFVFFNIFALNMYLQYQKVGRWKDYLWGECMFIVLSLLAKTALAWQIWAGTLAPV